MMVRLFKKHTAIFAKLKFAWFVGLSLVFSFLIGEVFIRIYQKLAHNIYFAQSIHEYYDKELGWKGKQVFGDRFTPKYKVFFIGDSFTEGCGVKEKNMYYNVVAKNLDAEVFVYGGPGYGTLQEYMVLNRYIDEIRPDLIVLQVCNNDFINNLLELESASFYNNDLMTRPYFVDGKIVYHFPKFLGNLRMFLYHSRLINFLGYSFDRFLAELCKKKFLHSVDQDITEKGMNFKNFRKAVEVTDTLIKKIKKRSGRVPIVAFPVDDYRNYFEQFRRIFKENGIDFIEEVPKIIRKKNTEGVEVYLKKQLHWNEAGHRICGDVLSKKLQKRVINKN